MNLGDLDRRRIVRDISKKAEDTRPRHRPHPAMLLLREFGLANATIAIALGLDGSVVSSWATGNKPCPEERGAELDRLLREVCGMMLKHETIPPEAWFVCGQAYYRALAYLGESSVVTVEERIMLSNAGSNMVGGVAGYGGFGPTSTLGGHHGE